MILWGIAQEFIMTNVYVGRNGESLQIPSSLFLVLCNRASATAFSALILKLRQKQLFFDGCLDSLPPAVSNSLASWCQYSSLSYISFGLQTTAKSTKILPVVIISSLRGKLHSLTDYAECIVLTASCFVFGHESETGFDSSTTATGLILLAIYIMCDSLTPHLQDVLFIKHREIDVVQATLAMSSFALAIITAELLLTGAMFSSFSFIWQCPDALMHMLVLSLASTVTQYMISYTIKNFGPVVYTLIASTRQVLSVLVSCVLFQHDMSGLSIVAMSIIFGTLIVRAVRPLAKEHQELVSVEPEVFQRMPLLNFSARLSRFSPLFVCSMAIHVVYLVYSLLQEFLSSHTFESDLFNFPLTLVALSHTAGALLSLAALASAGHQVVVPGMVRTLLPATTDLVATSLQHAALYLMFFPAQSLMKTLKVLPVMLVGSCLQNRVYSRLDYVEGFLLTCFVAFFVWDFQIHEAEEVERKLSLVGILMMVGYLSVDSFTSNFQDHIYQTTGLEPGHMLLGMESISAAMAWILTIISGELPLAYQFIRIHPAIIFFLAIFAMSAAVGAFSCVLTVRLFGPAVFTLIMTSRAIMSLLLSVVCFQHQVAWEECLCLIVVSLVMLISSTRRVSAQLRLLDMPKTGDRLTEGVFKDMWFLTVAADFLRISGTCRDTKTRYTRRPLSLKQYTTEGREDEGELIVCRQRALGPQIVRDLSTNGVQTVERATTGYKLRKAADGRNGRPLWQHALDFVSRPVQSISVMLPDTSTPASDMCTKSSLPASNSSRDEHTEDTTDLIRLASHYTVVDQRATTIGTASAEDDKSFCAIALYPFDPASLGGTEPGSFLALGVGQLMQVTHDSQSGWFWGHGLTEPEAGGYFPKSHVVSFAAFCKLQRMYYSKKGAVLKKEDIGGLWRDSGGCTPHARQLSTAWNTQAASKTWIISRVKGVSLAHSVKLWIGSGLLSEGHGEDTAARFAQNMAASGLDISCAAARMHHLQALLLEAAAFLLAGQKDPGIIAFIVASVFVAKVLVVQTALLSALCAMSSSDEYYVKAYQDFWEMGLEGAASQVLAEGLAAHPGSARLQQLAGRKPVESQASGYVSDVSVQRASDGVASDWKAPPGPSSALDRNAGDPAVQTFRCKQLAHADFVGASEKAWRECVGQSSWAELKQKEQRLRKEAGEAFAACKESLLKNRLEFRTELLRTPLTPDALTETAAALSGTTGDAALRRLLDSPGIFQDPSLWSSEGPGRLLEHARQMSEIDALPARARELAQTGGVLGKLLASISQEVRAELKGKPATVLVIGGHGVSAVSAVRAGAARVVLWEPLLDVAAAAQEVLRRNLLPEEVARCEVSSSEPLPSGPWDLVVVDRWHGLGVFSWGPMECLRKAASSASLGQILPARLRVSVALADAGLKASGFDLTAMDARFRALSAGPLKVGTEEFPHATALKPVLLTDFSTPVFDWQLTDSAEEGPVPFCLEATANGKASVAVICTEICFPSGKSVTLSFAQWMAGGVSLRAGQVVSGLQARRNDGRVWIDWDYAKSAEPPFGFMALSEWYFEMLRDSARHDLYEQALQAEITKAKELSAGACTVLDVGSGDGILSMMAIRSGATAGIGVEYVTQIARASEEVISANRSSGALGAGPLDVWCTDVRGVPELPEQRRFDVLVSELMDASGLGENLILLTEGSKRRLCKQHAPVIPARLRLKAVLCEVKLPDIDGVEMDAFWPFWPTDRAFDAALWLGVDLDKKEGQFKVLTETVELFEVELGKADVNEIPARAQYNFPGIASGACNMVVWWFEAQLSQTDPSLVLTNAPTQLDGRHAATCWGQAAAELMGRAKVRPGETTSIFMEMVFGDYQLRFKSADHANTPGIQFRDEPPPGAAPYTTEFKDMLKAWRSKQKKLGSVGRDIGRTAIRDADVEAVAVLQKAALAVALHPQGFGVEPASAAKILSGWYAVGGEGRT
ncbi:slc35b2 [Symbiodinium natans]|uniref:Slc35b2 protein n=1 Tax=Symbiodinium natans TaxID=878477 RepID=A0A812HZY2_9DINO|nr:slc35b2 [Symbiodinium natans]